MLEEGDIQINSELNDGSDKKLESASPLQEEDLSSDNYSFPDRFDNFANVDKNAEELKIKETEPSEYSGIDNNQTPLLEFQSVNLDVPHEISHHENSNQNNSSSTHDSKYFGDADSFDMLNLHYSGEHEEKMKNFEFELCVVNTCKDILSKASQHSLKAVELANTLRALLGAGLMSQIREKCGGLLLLLERFDHMFRVHRIPKHDFVSLLSGGPNEIDNALQYIPAEAVSTSCLHVGNVPTTYNEETLREEFELYGSVESVNIITQRNRRFAFVSFHSVENASQAKLMLSRIHPWKGAISFARKEHPSKINSTATTSRISDKKGILSENPQDKINLNRRATTSSKKSSSPSYSSTSYDQLTQRESYSNYIRSHHEGESFSAPPFLNLRSKYTMMPYNSGAPPTSNNRTKHSTDAATCYQPTTTTTTTTTTTAMPYNYSEQLSMARSGSHSSSSSLSALFRSSQGGVNNPDNNLTTNRDRYLSQDKPPGLAQSQRTLSFHQIRNDQGNHRSEFSSIIPAYRSQTQRFDPAISRNINLSRSNSNSNSSSGNSLTGDFHVRGSYITESVTASLPSTTTKAFQSSSSSSYTTNNDSPSPHPPPRYEGRPPANETLNYENELQFIDSITSNHSNYLFLESQNKLQQKQQQQQKQQHQQQQLSRAIDSTQLPPYTSSSYNTNYLPADSLLRSLPRHIHSMSSSSENIESSYHYDTISINNTVFNNRDHRTVATKFHGISNPLTQYNNNNNNMRMKSTSFVNSTYALPDPTLQTLHKLNDRSFVNPRPWEVDTEEDLPYCDLVQNILAEQGGASTILKITDTLSALFQCNIQLLAVKAMLESYPQYFVISGSHVSLVKMSL